MVKINLIHNKDIKNLFGFLNFVQAFASFLKLFLYIYCLSQTQCKKGGLFIYYFKYT